MLTALLLSSNTSYIRVEYLFPRSGGLGTVPWFLCITPIEVLNTASEEYKINVDAYDKRTACPFAVVRGQRSHKRDPIIQHDLTQLWVLWRPAIDVIPKDIVQLGGMVYSEWWVGTRLVIRKDISVGWCECRLTPEPAWALEEQIPGFNISNNVNTKQTWASKVPHS